MSPKTTAAKMMVSLALVMMTGCASGPSKVTQFWPPAPDVPRIQYLKKVGDSTDVVERKSISLLDTGNDTENVIPLIKPYGIAAANGKLYVCDSVQTQVVIFDLPRKKASVLSGNKGEGQLKKPINVAVDSDGFIYVADSGRKQILKYAPDGSYLRAIGEDGVKPVNLAVDDLYVYLLDGANGVVQLYDRKTSEPVRKFGQEGDERGRLFQPLGIGLDGKGGVYVSTLDGRLVHFDRDGHPQRAFGKVGTGLAEFNRPRSIAFDRDGVMYVVDAASQNVRLLNEGFQLLMSFGEPGTPASLNVPAGVAVSEEDLPYYQQFADPDFVLERVIFAVSQVGDNKISVYGMGRKKGIDYDALLKERLEEIRKKEERIARDAAAKEQKEKDAAKGAASGAPAPDGKR